MNTIRQEPGNLKAVGQFFYGEHFNEPAFVVARGSNGFKLDKTLFRDTDLQKKVQSVRWLANFTPQQSGVYTFTIKPDSFSHVFINGENVKNQGVQLEAGREYSFLVAFFGNPMVEPEMLFQLDVQYTFNNQKQKEVEVASFSIPEIASFEKTSNARPFQNAEEEKPLLDTDNDGIYDEWEINGYTVINHVVYPWKEEYAAKGYKKYVSNPNESHTAGDPYSDLEKASGALDRTISKVAWDPMVAVYPSITVGMEELVLSRDAKTGETTGKSVSRTTSSSVSDSNTLGIDASASLSMFGPSVSVTGHYSHTSTHTVDSSNTSGQNWQEELSLDQGQAAHLNANVRYYNTGTAPVYNLVPTTNLVLGKETIATVTGQENHKAVSIAPGQAYPKRHLHGLALNTLDQFSSNPISINIEQLNRLESGEKLKLETDQFLGAFARRDPAGGQVVMEENEWADYMPQIENSTAGILINIDGNRFIERRIAARDNQNPNDLTPELTLEQALEKSIGAIYDRKENNWYFVDSETDVKHILSSDLVHFVFDKKTKKLIEGELNKKPEKVKDIYKMTIRPGMNIQIDVPVLYDDFAKDSDKWSGGNYDNTNALNKGRCYKISTGGEGVYGEFNLECNSKYQIMMTIKGSGESIVRIDKEGAQFKEVFLLSGEYENKKVVINTLGAKTEDLKFTIKNDNKAPLYIDNFAIVKIGKGIDKLRDENKVYKQKLADAFRISPVLSEELAIANDANSVILKKGIDATHKLQFMYDVVTGAFFIESIYDNEYYSLTWDVQAAELVFAPRYESYEDFTNKRYQLWFIKKSGIEGEQSGYQIINAADRSKALDFRLETPSEGNLIKVEKLDGKKSSQYFKFPQKIESKVGKVMWASLKEHRKDVTVESVLMEIPTDYEDNNGKREIDLLFFNSDMSRLDMRKYEGEYSEDNILSRTTTTDEYKEKGHMNVEIKRAGTTILTIKNKETKEKIWSKKIKVL